MILQIILNMQTWIEAIATKQEIVIVQMDMDKAYDHLTWYFHKQLMHIMGLDLPW